MAIEPTREQRQALAKDFANTHLGKIAAFIHSIDRDGKLIVSADAIDILATHNIVNYELKSFKQMSKMQSSTHLQKSKLIFGELGG